jgi:hypothetical protein
VIHKNRRVCIKVCFKLGKIASETCDMLQKAFGENFLLKAQMYRWFSRLKGGQTSVETKNIMDGHPHEE